MGLGGISIWQLLIILAIVVLLFGTKKLKNIGGDLGGAVKGFKDAMGDKDGNEDTAEQKNIEEQADASTSPEQSSAEQKNETK